MKYTTRITITNSDDAWSLFITTTEDEGPNRQSMGFEKQLAKSDKIFKNTMQLNGTTPDGNILTGWAMAKSILQQWLEL